MIRDRAISLFIHLYLIFPIIVIADENELEIMKGDVVFEDEKKNNTVITVAHAVVVSDLESIKNVLLDCKKHVEFMPSYEGCDNRYMAPDKIYGSVKIKPPFTSGIKYYLSTTLKSDNNIYTISWSMDRSKKVKYIKNTYGFWRIKPVAENAFIITLFTNTEFDFHWSVNWFLEPIINGLIENDMPGVLTGVRARIETREKWKLRDNIPQPLIAKEKGD